MSSEPQSTGTTVPPPLAAINVVKCREMSVPQAKSDGTNPPSGNTKPLSPRQRAAAMMLVAGKTVDAVALALGINPRTIFRWKKLPSVNDAIERGLSELRISIEAAQARRSTVRVRAIKRFPGLVPVFGGRPTPGSERQRRPGFVGAQAISTHPAPTFAPGPLNFDTDNEADEDDLTAPVDHDLYRFGALARF